MSEDGGSNIEASEERATIEPSGRNSKGGLMVLGRVVRPRVGLLPVM